MRLDVLTRINRKVLWAVALGGLLVAIAFVMRTLVANYTDDIGASWGTFWDFRDASYYSVKAALDGNIPYDVNNYMANYPVGQTFPVLPPLYLVVHAPFAILGPFAASIAMLLLNLIGIGWLVWWSLRLSRHAATPLQIVSISALVILSTGGRNLLFSGQTTLLFVAGTYLAITAYRPAGGALGVILAFIKPTFGLPVAVLTAAAGKWRRAVAGTVITGGISAVLMIPFVIWAGGLGPLLDMLFENLGSSADSEGIALATTTGRVDAAAAIARVFGIVPPESFEYVASAAVIGLAAYILYRSRSVLSRGNANDAVIVLISIATVAGLYHSVYDLMILVLPMLLLARPDFAGGGVSLTYRLGILGALLVADFNPFKVDFVVGLLGESSRMAEFLGPGLTGAALLVALALTLVTVSQLREDTRLPHTESPGRQVATVSNTDEGVANHDR